MVETISRLRSSSKERFRKIVVRLIKSVFFRSVAQSEDYHEGIYRGYDGKWLNIFLKIFATPGVWKRELKYYGFFTPRTVTKEIFSDDRWQKALSDLRKLGIAKIEGSFAGLADHIDTHYFDRLEKTPDLLKPGLQRISERTSVYSRFSERQLDKTEEDIKTGVQFNRLISFSDPKLTELLLDENLHKLVSSYYGRQHFVRNHPALLKTDWRKGQPMNYNGHYHFDHFHQLSMIFSISDVRMEDTHTEYALGSHRYVRTSIHPNGHYYSRKYVYDHYQIQHAIGPRGTLHIFDTAGLHAGLYQESDNPRKMLHMNFTTGHDIESIKFTSEADWPEISQQESNITVKRAFSKILCNGGGF